MKFQLIIILVMALIVVLFTFQNPHPVPMHFVGWGTRDFPVIGVVLISVIAGVILSVLWGLISNSKLKEEIFNLKRKLHKVQAPPVNPEEEEPPDFMK
ncbi:MAG: LapA family protein [Planctomycetes bacterium]|nr:LapA family protein [Planctomycetota bacterium]